MNGIDLETFKSTVNWFADIALRFWNVLHGMPGIWFTIWLGGHFVFPWLKRLVRALRGV